MTKYRIIIFLTIVSTKCFAEDISNSDVSGEWWGGIDGRMSQVITIDEKIFYFPISAGHYKAKLYNPIPYKLEHKNNNVYFQFEHHKKQYSPVIQLPKSDTLLMTFSNNTAPPWKTSAKGKTLTYIRTPEYVDDNHFHGQWANRKSGFKFDALNILADGNATLFGAVSGVELCWKRNSNSSIKIEMCNKMKMPTSKYKDFYMILSPTPTKERIIVETTNNKSLWKRPKKK